ncbi:MAG: glycogen/starch synthase [Patescibacteria group bacterium]|jgi:starch synthase
MKPTRVLFAAAEMAPLAKAGGLGDVIGGLPLELQKQVDRLVIALPFYEEIPRPALHSLERITTLTVKVGQQSYSVVVWKARYKTMSLLLFQQPDFLSQGKIYDGFSVLNPLTGLVSSKDAVGQALRYVFFSYAVYAFICQRPKDFNIIHAHDYHMAPLVALLHNDLNLSHLKTIYTIHNLGYAGSLLKPIWEQFTPSLYRLFDFTEALRPKGPRMSWLGIKSADYITTVSPQYAKEIITPEYGNDFELLLQQRQSDLYSVLNGIDTKFFDPTVDPAVQVNFSWRTIKQRERNKIFLQRQCGLPINNKIPVIGIVTRLDTPKGMNLITHSLTELSRLPVQYVICGNGIKRYTTVLRAVAKLRPEQWHFHNKFDTTFSQYVYAGSDIFLMPSRHEPCGLAQLIAMRYGAVPVVRATGGLKDTVHEGYNGFVFTKYSSAAMLTTLKRAIKVYQREPDIWQQLVLHGMKGDYSWKKSALAYAKLYRSLLK